MSEHTKEPWFTVETEYDVIEITNADRNGVIVPIAKVSTGYVNQVGIEQESNARRIVACVNVLAGVSTDHLEQYGLPDFAQKISDLIQQRDNLLAARKLSDERILELAESFGEFKYGDAQGCKRIEFARAIEREILGGGHD